MNIESCFESLSRSVESHTPGRRPGRWLGCAALVALAGCGGGSSGDAAPTADPQHCAAPRSPGTLDENGQAYGDVQGSVADEKAWVRGWIDNTYLWYQDVRNLSVSTLDPTRYSTATGVVTASPVPSSLSWRSSGSTRAPSWAPRSGASPRSRWVPWHPPSSTHWC